jgi:hypothetical protein
VILPQAFVTAVLFSFLISPAVSGQWPVRYTAGQLNCARFVENAQSRIETESGGRRRQQTSGRSGVWQFRATPAKQEVALEGWLDSLTVWRRSPEAMISPDTDGLLGGRYRGILSGNGAYLARVRPFVPDEVAEVAGMGTALDDFFPPLPPQLLKAGQVWADSGGVIIRRLPDSAMSGVPLFRFSVETQSETRAAAVPDDTLRLQLKQVSEEHGTFVWHPLLGVVRRDRRIVVRTTVPASKTVRQPVRSKVEQQITVLRDLTVPPSDSGRCRSIPS